MKTTETAVSTICYSTPDYVKMRLDIAVKQGLLLTYAAMPHPAYEMDGKQRKAHLHLVIVPATRIDLTQVSTMLEQPDLEHPDLPNLGCEPWKKTRDDFIDWLAYAYHDRDYLGFKKASKKPYYNLDSGSLITNAPDLFKRVEEQFPRDKWKSDIQKILEAYGNGKTFYEFCVENRIQMSQIMSAQRAWTVCTRYIAEQAQKYGSELLQDIASIADELPKQ